MRKSHRKLLKLSKRNTINYQESSDEHHGEWQGPLKVLGFIRKIVEGAGQGNDMDQKVLASLVDSKSYNKLTNNTLDLKAIKENEIGENFSALKKIKYDPSDDDADSVSNENWASVHNKKINAKQSTHLSGRGSFRKKQRQPEDEIDQTERRLEKILNESANKN